jgi:oligopeptidase B
MNKTISNISFMAILLTISASSCGPEQSKEKPQAPVGKVVPTELSHHGVTRIDNYYWMNERDHPHVIAYLEAENAYTKEVMKHTEALQKSLFDEIVGRIKQTDMTVPYLANGYYYFTRYEEGKEYPLYCRKKGSQDAPEEVMLNVNTLAEGFSFYQLGSLEVTEDNRIVAYSADTLSRRIYAIHFKDLVTGATLEDAIPNTSGNFSWASDNRTLYYSVKDETLRPYRIYRHKLGTGADEDILVYEEKDATFNTYVYKTKSREYLVISSSSTLSDECRVLKADDPDGEFVVFQARQRGLEYFIAHSGDRFYIRTNLDAQNFRLMTALPGHTGSVEWKELIGHRSDVLLEDFEVFADFMAICERKESQTGIRIITGEGQDFYLGFPEEAFTVGLDNNPEYHTTMLRYSFTSMATPLSIFDFNVTDKSRTLLKQQEVLGGYDPSKYQGRRLFAISADDVRVPISLVYRKDLLRKEGNPLLIYGYGSYGASMDPYFSPVRLSLLDRGFIYAIAHIRGGEEMGRQWYEDGKLLKKKNTFTDFIACGEFLSREGYAAEGQLFAMGGSAGGLLIGAVINLRPDLFNAAIAAVPFVDVVTTMLDESIPLTTGEYDEWGDPNDREYFDYMLSYSPYDNVEPKDYPALLVTAGYHDSQVQYWEPAKWVAKLRVTKTGDAPLLLWTDMEYGHGGASGRFERYRETALEYALLLDRAGLTK